MEDRVQLITITNIKTREKSYVNTLDKTFRKRDKVYSVSDDMINIAVSLLENVCIKRACGMVKYTITLDYMSCQKVFLIHPEYNSNIETIERKMANVIEF